MSSKRALRRKACDGKVRHADAGGAHTALKKLARAKPDHAPGSAMGVYRCGFCGGWHIGHRKGSGGLRPS
jgi:hypothetical protein